MNVKKTKKFKENRPENYHVHDKLLEVTSVSALHATCWHYYLSKTLHWLKEMSVCNPPSDHCSLAGGTSGVRQVG